MFDTRDEKRPIREQVTRLFYMFLVFSMIGWIYEMLLFFIYGNPELLYNRGFLVGPYLPIYGVGTVILILLVYPLKQKAITTQEKIRNFFLSFLLIILITTGIELATTYIIDFLGMEPLWDYSKFNYNFQGRISLEHSLRFAFGGLAFLYLLVPLIDKLLHLFFERPKEILALIIAFILVIDTLYSIFFR